MAQSSRCGWVDLTKPDYIAYHDDEWGVPVYDERVIFEFLTLEAAQAGLSWYTVLKKRDNYRRAFSHFDPVKVARYNRKSIERLMRDEGLIRNRLKIESAISNARLMLQVQNEHGSFADYLWAFVNDVPIVNKPRHASDVPATSKESDTISKDLKARGFKFMGSTIVYAFMQAIGLVNDHTMDCFRQREIVTSYSQRTSPR